jgi:CelD/BcsL family acetyltransferase involved in cellulose biosynthesis
MKLELHRDPAVFENLKSEWNALAEKGVSRVPFVWAEYQRAWWRYCGGGEWPLAELLVVTARATDGQLLGIAPLFFAKNLDGRLALLFVGSIEISDYLDLVVAREQVDAFGAALLDRLTEPDVPDWEVLDLYNLPESSPTRSARARAPQVGGWGAVEQVRQPAPGIAPVA